MAQRAAWRAFLSRGPALGAGVGRHLRGVRPGRSRALRIALAASLLAPLAPVTLPPPAARADIGTPTASPPPLVTSDVVVAGAAPLRVAGVVRNPSASVAPGVEAHAIVYDASGGAIIGGGTERVGDLTPNGRTRVAVPLIASAPPAEAELYAIPSVLP